MDIPLRNPFDLAELDRRVRVESNAKQRDRYHAVRLVIAGEPTGTIMDKLGRSKNFVQHWCYFCRDGGIDAVTEKPHPGRPGIGVQTADAGWTNNRRRWRLYAAGQGRGADSAGAIRRAVHARRGL